MPHRDPQTGQFVADDGMAFDDIEVATFRAGAGVTAANNDGTTGFGGEVDSFEAIELVDYDDIVDRNEELRLLTASHALVVYVNSTSTADGTVAVAAEVSASPSRQTGIDASSGNTLDGDVVGLANSNDTIDLVGRPLVAVAHGPFTDGTGGTGGGGSSGDDSYDGDMFPAEFGRFHPRDELYLNGQFRTWNVADAGIHLELRGQHVYGVME